MDKIKQSTINVVKARIKQIANSHLFSKSEKQLLLLKYKVELKKLEDGIN